MCVYFCGCEGQLSHFTSGFGFFFEPQCLSSSGGGGGITFVILSIDVAGMGKEGVYSTVLI